MPEKKRLLLITSDFPPNRGGVARYLSNLATHFSDQITVIAEEDSRWADFDKFAHYPIYRMAFLYKRFWPRWWKTARYLKSVKSEYDLVLTSHVLPLGTAIMSAGMPYIVFVHGMDIRLAKAHSRKRAVAKKVLTKAQLVVANSQALANELLQDFGIQSLVVHPCLDRIDEINPWESEQLQLLTVSRLVERKGHALVLNALASLRRASRIPAFQYHIVGSGSMMSTLQSMVHTLGLESHVIFHGDINDEELQTRYAAADIFLMPVLDDAIDKEGFGYVYLEAAAHGVASIASNIPGVDEAVVDGLTGLLISPGDEGELAGAIEQLANNVEYRKTLGQEARNRVANDFLCEQQFGKLTEYL